jgi:hypothetical protein
MLGPVRTLEQIIELTRSTAGGDFAFVLTRKGRLVTHRAPRDMPEIGRARLVRAARPLIGSTRVIEVTVPREELVPYGGAAPVDVYVGVIAEQAILCVVMATWADKLRVASAMEAAMEDIEPLLKRGLAAGRRTPDLVPAKGSPYLEPPEAPGREVSLPEIQIGEAALGRESMVAVRRDHSVPDIAVTQAALGRESMAAVRQELGRSVSAPEIAVTEGVLGRESLAEVGRELGWTAPVPAGPRPATPLPRSLLPRSPLPRSPLPRPPAAGGSLPSISVTEGVLGRESLAAVGRDVVQRASAPSISVTEGALGRESMVAIDRELGMSASAPDIVVGEAALGRESLAAIDLDGKPKPTSSPEHIRVSLASMPVLELEEEEEEPQRMTLPWVELPADTKRTLDAARLGRGLAPPKVTVKVEAADENVIDAARTEVAGGRRRVPNKR